MKEFRISFLVTADWWGAQHTLGLWTALWLVTVLAVLEVSLSFDNAVVNAGVLKDMTPRLWVLPTQTLNTARCMLLGANGP